jgi:glycosyltransferase involved in cell wall biosynthesis
VGFNEEFIHVEHDCHDGIDFDGGKVGAELKIALEEHRTNYDFLAVYTGSLAKDRGLEILSEVTLSFKNVAFFIAGGNNSEKAYWSELLPNDNIMVYNRLTTDEVKYVQSQSDFLLGIWGGSIPTMEYCSPLKLFEYMAWGKPVILSDFQVFHEVVDEESVYFFEKESVESFIESFSKVINERMDFEDKRNALLKSASYFTWDKRADRIKAIIEKL